MPSDGIKVQKGSALRKKWSQNCSTLEPFWKMVQGLAMQFSQNSATGGVELRTMERLQGWSRFGSTCFPSVAMYILHDHFQSHY